MTSTRRITFFTFLSWQTMMLMKMRQWWLWCCWWPFQSAKTFSLARAPNAPKPNYTSSRVLLNSTRKLLAFALSCLVLSSYTSYFYMPKVKMLVIAAPHLFSVRVCWKLLDYKLNHTTARRCRGLWDRVQKIKSSNCIKQINRKQQKCEFRVWEFLVGKYIINGRSLNGDKIFAWELIFPHEKIFFKGLCILIVVIYMRLMHNM